MLVFVQDSNHGSGRYLTCLALQGKTMMTPILQIGYVELAHKPNVGPLQIRTIFEHNSLV